MGKANQKQNATCQPGLNLWLIAALLICGTAVYLPSFRVPFTFDDKLCIVQNAQLHSLQLGAIWDYTPTRFAAMLSFALNYHFGAEQVFGYHLVNLLIHLGTGLVLAYFLLRLTTLLSEPPSPGLHQGAILIACLFFLAHPLQTQAVTYIWQRTALMATFGFIACMAGYLEMRLAHAAGNLTRARRCQVLALLALGLAIFAKEIALSLPVVLLALELLLLRQLPRPGLAWLLPFALGVLPIPLIVLAHQDQYAASMPSVMEGYTPLSPGSYLLTQASVIFTYLRLLVFPIPQQIDYDYPIAHGLSDIWPELLGLTLIAALLVWSWKRHPLFCFAALTAASGLAVETVAVTLPDVIFEHRMYLPMIGFSIGLYGALHALKRVQRPLYILGFALLAVLAALTWQRNQLWRDPIELWTDNLAHAPKRARVWTSRALAYRERHELDKALADVEQAIALNPAYRLPLVSRALILAQLDRHSEALPDYDRALAMKADDSDIRNARGITLISLKRYEAALADFTYVRQHRPDWAQTYNYQGVALSALGRDPEALQAFDQALARDADYGDAYLNRALVRVRLGQAQEAVSDYEHYLERVPDQRQAYVALASLLNRLHRPDEAQLWLDRAIARFPDYATAYFNRAVLAHDRGAWPEAIADFSAALKHQPKPLTYYWRGTVYLKQGEREQAARDFREAAAAGVALPPEVRRVLDELQ